MRNLAQAYGSPARLDRSLVAPPGPADRQLRVVVRPVRLEPARTGAKLGRVEHWLAHLEEPEHPATSRPPQGKTLMNQSRWFEWNRSSLSPRAPADTLAMAPEEGGMT